MRIEVLYSYFRPKNQICNDPDVINIGPKSGNSRYLDWIEHLRDNGI